MPAAKRSRSKGLRLKCVGGIWYADGSVAYKRIRRSLGTRDETRAQELKAELEARLWNRHSHGEEAVRTFEEAALDYMRQGGEALYLAPLIRHFKGRLVASIKPAEIRAAAAAIYPNGAPATRNRQGITPARAVVMHGHNLGWCGPIRVKQFPVPKSRKHKAVDRAWIEAFMAEADGSNMPHLATIVLFMHQTGARVSEAVRLTGEHVDLGQRMAMLERTKTDEWSPRELTAELCGRIAALGPKAGQPVFFYSDPKAVNRALKRVAARAGIEPLSTHSVGRHSFATNALESGVSIKDAMDAGGYRTAKLFMETYVHSRNAGRAVVEKLDALAGPIDMNKASGKVLRRASFGKRSLK